MSSTVSNTYDVVIVGAGPAGLAAATTCAEAGLTTVIFDEQSGVGGQIYRSITETAAGVATILGQSYERGRVLVEAFKASGVQYVPRATVWSLTSEREVGVSWGGGSQLVRGKRVIICTGSMERPFPIPGWTLPGVMSAGAAQILLKSSGLIAEGRTVIAGCGPLLWLIAAQYLKAGAKLEAILDTTPRENRKRAAPHLFPFIFSGYFREGLALTRSVKRRARVISGVTSLRATGEASVSAVSYRCGDSAEETLLVDHLFLHHGVVPNSNLGMSVGLRHQWDENQLSWIPWLRGDGSSSISGIALAGDCAGIGGAEAARSSGVLAGLNAARALGRRIPRSEVHDMRRTLERSMRGRRFLDELFRPAEVFRQPKGDTIVCRCEEITAQQVVEAITLGSPGPNQLKAFSRCGMGACQGRMCGLTVTELMARARGLSPQEIGYYHVRSPVKPITVAELAALPKSDAAVKAVVRL
jgi:thioredoxin reductase